MARFANVAFSDGSLLYGFNKRIEKKQPIVAPNDIKRYFIVPEESGELCLMSCIFGENRDIFFPKLNKNLNLINFSNIALLYLKEKGLEPVICNTEEQARSYFKENKSDGNWPCLFTNSDTSGEKKFEEFFTENEKLDMDRFDKLGVIKNELNYQEQKLLFFEKEILRLKRSNVWDKKKIKELFNYMIPDFGHKETGKHLDNKM
jgi:FlaA1/EpsC-like NDP-sugar epimerase